MHVFLLISLVTVNISSSVIHTSISLQVYVTHGSSSTNYLEKHKFRLLFDLAARLSSSDTSGFLVVDMGDDVLEGNEVLVRSTNVLGSFLRRIQLCIGKSCIDPESVPKLA